MTIWSNNNQYREIINKNFKAKFDEKKAQDIVKKLYEKTDPDDTEKIKNIKHLSHQLSFISQCMKEGTLPLPILKKLKSRSLVLDNYQMNLMVAQAFGKSLQHLGDSIDSIFMSNNNMKDEAAASVLEGLMKTSVSKFLYYVTISPIGSIIIQNNTLEKLSMSVLNQIIKRKSSDKDDESILIRLKHLELNNCHAKPSLIQEFTEWLKANREIESLNLLGVQLDTKCINNLGDFVSNNFNLKKLALWWSQLRSADLVRLMERVKDVKHLEHLDLSAIPFEGPKALEITNLVKDHIILNHRLIHLNMTWWNLDANELEILAQGIKKSRSLLAVHFSGNSMLRKSIFYLIFYSID